jgi:hypothetical protein
MKSQTAPALPGRPRAFDADVALERAMHVLWAKRYEGASIHYPSVIRPGLSRLQMRTCSRALYPTSSLSSSVSRKLAQHIHDAVHPPGTILDRFSRSALRPSDTHCSTLIGFIGMVRGSNPSLASTGVFVSGGCTTVSSINFVNAAGLRPQDSAFVGLSHFPSIDRNYADEELSKLRFGFF